MSDAPCLMMTGGTGFVGRYLAPSIVSLFPGHRRVMLVRSTDGPEARDWERVVVDLTSETEVDAVVAQLRPAVIVHLAAQSSAGPASESALTTWTVNSIGTFNLARAVARYAKTRLVFFSSTGEVYGASCLSGAVDERSPAAPMNSYGLSKLAAERILQDVLPPRTRLIITRAFNHSGAGQDERFVLPSFASQLVRAEKGGGPTSIAVGNLEAERDFLHVKDVVDAYVGLIARAEVLPRRTLVNVASGQSWRLSALLEKIIDRSRIPIKIVEDRARMRPSEIPRSVGNSSLIRHIIGWSPHLTVDNIIDDLLADFRDHA